MGLNELHTLLRDAVAAQDFVEAGRISNEVMTRLYGSNLSVDEKRFRRRRMSWRGLGAAPWLAERLDALNYTFPTTIQINAMEAVNAILNSTAVDLVNSDVSLEERVDRSDRDMGIVVSGTTGSGKTLAYLVPLLSTLSDSLFKRQKIRVGAEEMVGDTTGDLLDRVAIVTSPVVRSNSRRQVTKANGPIATGASLATLGPSGKDVTSPLALIVVPTRELGVQIALQLYQLVGGNLKDSATQMSSSKSNMFKFKGPKGVRIGCVLDDDEALFGLKLQTDVAITTPQYLGKLVQDGDVKPSKLRVVVYDEADLGLEQTPASVLEQVFDDDVSEREYTRLAFLVGASVTEALGNLAVSSRILPSGKSYIATATRFAPLLEGSSSVNDDDKAASSPISGLEEPRTASLKDLDVCLYPGLKHERAVVRGEKGLLVLTRLLRKELQDYEAAVASGTKTPPDRPRVVVFFPDEPQARAAIAPLRDALWGEHRLCVLLPKTGERPLNIMDQFKQNETSVMLATPNSVRGLDFPAVSHVYTLYLPMDDPREYVHLAGRVGRVGQRGCVMGDGGHVVSILKDDEADRLEALAASLGFEFTDIDTSFDLVPRLEDGSVDTESADIEKLRRFLEDTMTLVDLADEPVVDVNAVRSLVLDDADDQDDEDEEEDEADKEEDFQ
jgi:superfamily II DNA/RNA helicase